MIVCRLLEIYQIISDIFDNIFYKKFGVRSRSNVVFATTSTEIAKNMML